MSYSHEGSENKRQRQCLTGRSSLGSGRAPGGGLLDTEPAGPVGVEVAAQRTLAGGLGVASSGRQHAGCVRFAVAKVWRWPRCTWHSPTASPCSAGSTTAPTHRRPHASHCPASLAVDETVILLHPPLSLVGVSIVMERERQRNDSLANGQVRGARPTAGSNVSKPSSTAARPPGRKRTSRRPPRPSVTASARRRAAAWNALRDGTPCSRCASSTLRSSRG